MSPTMSWPRRSEPTGMAHATPGTPRSASSTGSAMSTARPSGTRGMRARSAGSALLMADSTSAPRPGIARIVLLTHRGGDVGRRHDSERAMKFGELLDRDDARFEQPSQIGRKVGDRRFDQHPAAGLVHLPQSPEHFGIGAEGRVVEERAGVRVGFDPVRPHERRGPAPTSRRRSCRRESSPATPAVRVFDGKATQMSLGNRQESAG